VVFAAAAVVAVDVDMGRSSKGDKRLAVIYDFLNNKITSLPLLNRSSVVFQCYKKSSLVFSFFFLSSFRVLFHI